MKNIWLNIKLSDYEEHMALPDVAQSQYLAQYLFNTIELYNPGSVAILGSSGGNGLEKIDRNKVKKIICVDINANFLEAAKNRYHNNFDDIEFICQDIASSGFTISNVDLVYAGLVFEYICLKPAILNISKFLNKNGKLAVILQQPNEKIPEVTPSKYKSLEKLSELFRFVSPIEFSKLCEDYDIKLISQNETELKSGKKFTELIFQKF
jgi:SAM-dependent methyltransferase